MRPVINRKSHAEIELIGNDKIGLLYLEKRYSISVGERIEIDGYEATKSKAQISATKLIRKIAKDKNVTFQEAQDLIYPKTDGNTVVDNSELIIDYAEDFTDLRYQSDIEGISLEVAIATIFIKNRIAYPVTVLEEASINASFIVIEPTSICLNNKQQIKFGNVTAVVRGNHHEDVDTIQVEPLTGKILEGTTGFLSNGNKYVLGTDDWTSDDTKLLDENLVNQIFRFYENERLGWEKRDNDIPNTETEVGEQQKLTGTNSIGESSPTESATLDLVAGTVS